MFQIYFLLLIKIFFKGNWVKKFDPARTKLEPFYLGSTEKKIDAHMMHIDGDFRVGAVDSLDARVLELNYVVGKYF